MYARVHQLAAGVDRIDDAAEHFQTTIARAYGALAGFRGALLLADRATGDMLSIALFSSAEAVDETATQSVAEVIRGSLVAGAHEVPVGQQFEVIAQVR